MSAGVSTPVRGSSASGSSEVAGMGMGSNTHQTMHSVVIPRVIAASAGKPEAYMRYPANNATIGPATMATFCVEVVDDVGNDIPWAPQASKVANAPTAKQLVRTQ
jgi:hypothetical protein